MPHRSVGLIILMSATLLSGCRSSKSPANLYSPTPQEIAGSTTESRFESLCATYTPWQQISIPAKISLNTPVNMSASARVTMRRGEWINISLRMFTMEVARIFIDNDSIHAADKFNKRYLSESITTITSRSGLRLNDIQNLLLGRAFLLGEKGGTLSSRMLNDITLTSSPNGLMLIPKHNEGAIEYGFIMQPDINALAAASFIYNHNRIDFTFADITMPDTNTLMPKQIGLNAKTSYGTIDVAVNWDLGKARWDDTSSSQWTTPKGYQRLNAIALLNSLKSF